MSDIKIKKLHPKAEIPTRGSKNAAGYDIYACVEPPRGIAWEDYGIVIQPHQTVKVGTGLSMELPDGTFAGIFARSGLSSNKGIRPANCVGVVDSDYRGEYIVACHNDSDSIATIMNGDRIAQLVLLPFIPMEFSEANSLSETERGSGGFGSTGISAQN